jgi:hypothetical protein
MCSNIKQLYIKKMTQDKKFYKNYTIGRLVWREMWFMTLIRKAKCLDVIKDTLPHNVTTHKTWIIKVKVQTKH